MIKEAFVTIAGEVLALAWVALAVSAFMTRDTGLSLTLGAVAFMLPGLGCTWFAFAGRGRGPGFLMRSFNTLGTFGFLVLGVGLLVAFGWLVVQRT